MCDFPDAQRVALSTARIQELGHRCITRIPLTQLSLSMSTNVLERLHTCDCLMELMFCAIDDRIYIEVRCSASSMMLILKSVPQSGCYQCCRIISLDIRLPSLRVEVLAPPSGYRM
jgi:hypothetical protein